LRQNTVFSHDSHAILKKPEKSIINIVILNILLVKSKQA